MRKLAVTAGVLALTALTWFEFPGHTWLEEDTQIYAPILEHLRDPTVLGRDLIVERPHVSFTLYDETARALRRVTGLSFRDVLEGEQLATRALGIWGLYLMAAALGLTAPAALLVAGIVSLGATIAGPAVLSVELEPDPRGFALPLLLLAIGLAAHGWDLAAGMAGSAAFLTHPPTVFPFWGVYAALAMADAERRRWRAFVPLTAAAIVLAVAARFQDGASEAQLFFARIPSTIEYLQRLRAPYSWISAWWREWLPQYIALYAASLLAYARLRKGVPRALRFFLIGLPLVGMASMPASYLLLEKMKWVLLPQMQPMRALLFVTVMAQFAGAAAGMAAAQSRRYGEALAWFVLVYLIPLDAGVRWYAVVLLAAGASFAAWAEGRRFRWSAAALAGVAAAGFFVLPPGRGEMARTRLDAPELQTLSAWARASTARDAVFLFADAGKQLQPGVFRSAALRAIYVDWKGGGQVNYLPELGEEWWRRWRAVFDGPFDARGVERYGVLGIDYIVLSRRHRLGDRAPVFENGGYVVYRVSG